MGRIIGTILGALLAIWLVVTAAGGIFATLKTFLIIGLIAMAVIIVVWLVAGRTHHASDHRTEDEHGHQGHARGDDG